MLHQQVCGDFQELRPTPLMLFLPVLKEILIGACTGGLRIEILPPKQKLDGMEAG